MTLPYDDKNHRMNRELAYCERGDHWLPSDEIHFFRRGKSKTLWHRNCRECHRSLVSEGMRQRWADRKPGAPAMDDLTEIYMGTARDPDQHRAELEAIAKLAAENSRDTNEVSNDEGDE